MSTGSRAAGWWFAEQSQRLAGAARRQSKAEQPGPLTLVPRSAQAWPLAANTNTTQHFPSSIPWPLAPCPHLHPLCLALRCSPVVAFKPPHPTLPQLPPHAPTLPSFRPTYPSCLGWLDAAMVKGATAAM